MERTARHHWRWPANRARPVLAALLVAVLVVTPALEAQTPARPASGQQVVLVTGSTSGLGRRAILGLSGFSGTASARSQEVTGRLRWSIYLWAMPSRRYPRPRRKAAKTAVRSLVGRTAAGHNVQ